MHALVLYDIANACVRSCTEKWGGNCLLCLIASYAPAIFWWLCKSHTHSEVHIYQVYTHAHHVPHTEHMEQSDEMVKHSRDDVEDFEDVSWTPCCPLHVPFTGQQRRRLSSKSSIVSWPEVHQEGHVQRVRKLVYFSRKRITDRHTYKHNLKLRPHKHLLRRLAIM